MAQVKGTVNEGRSYTYKGKTYGAGEEIVFLKPEDAHIPVRNDLVVLDKETEKKVDAALEKKEKKSNAGPGK